MIGIEVRGDFEIALRKFKKQVEKDGDLATYRLRSEGALSKTEKRKAKDQAAARRRKQREKRRKFREVDSGLTKMMTYHTLKDKSYEGRSTPPNAGGSGGGKRSWGPGSGSEISNNQTPTSRQAGGLEGRPEKAIERPGGSFRA